MKDPEDNPFLLYDEEYGEREDEEFQDDDCSWFFGNASGMVGDD